MPLVLTMWQWHKCYISLWQFVFIQWLTLNAWNFFYDKSYTESLIHWLSTKDGHIQNYKANLWQSRSVYWITNCDLGYFGDNTVHNLPRNHHVFLLIRAVHQWVQKTFKQQLHLLARATEGSVKEGAKDVAKLRCKAVQPCLSLPAPTWKLHKLCNP